MDTPIRWFSCKLVLQGRKGEGPRLTTASVIFINFLKRDKTNRKLKFREQKFAVTRKFFKRRT